MASTTSDVDPGRLGGGPSLPQRPGPVRSVLAFLRNLWRRLTSMRTALVLLFLLALASLPGALLPQRSLNRVETAQFILDNPTWGPWLDRLGFFAVFASPWYAAVYLLLFISLIGCLLPRTWDFVGQLRAVPVATPRNLSRLPLHHSSTVDGGPDEVAQRVYTALTGSSGRRWRAVQRTEADGAQTISAERGYLRELGNLVFHISLLGVLLSVAGGKLFGYEGSVIVANGDGFCSVNSTSYNDFRPGLTIDGTELNPFCLNLKGFDTDYTADGLPIEFRAHIEYQHGADAGGDTWNDTTLRVNEPLRVGGERIYLLGHGFAPHFEVTFPGGQVRQYSQPFIPDSSDPNFLSEGTIKITDPPGVTGDEIRKQQLAITGLFAPTAVVHGSLMQSSFPRADDPGVAIDVYRGDLGMEGGKPQSVFSVDQAQIDKGALVKQTRANLMAGESVTLDDGTKITFTGYSEWVSLQTSYDPAQLWLLISAVLLLLGLTVSLSIKRRRVWFRMRPADGASGSRTVVEVGGLARTDQAGYGEEFTELAALAATPVAGTQKGR